MLFTKLNMFILTGQRDVSGYHGTSRMTRYRYILSTRWWHQMETFFALLAICSGNSPVTGEFPSQRPVMRSFEVFFHLRLNKRLSQQTWGWWFETPSRSLWLHCNVMMISYSSITLSVFSTATYRAVVFLIDYLSSLSPCAWAFCSLCVQTSYHLILRNLEVGRSGVRINVSLWYSMGAYRCKISERSSDSTSHGLVNTGPGICRLPHLSTQLQLH